MSELQPPAAEVPESSPQRVKRIADGVYGTVLVLAVVAALSKDARASAASILGGTLATSFVFWLVHVYAHVLARRAVGDTARTRALVGQAAHDEWPLVEAALLPAVPLTLWVIGALGRQAAITLALLVGLANLAVMGFVAARAGGQSWPRAALSAAAVSGVGTVMVLLKNLVH